MSDFVSGVMELAYNNINGEVIEDLAPDYPKEDWYQEIHKLITANISDDKLQNDLLNACVQLEHGMFSVGFRTALNLVNLPSDF